MMEEAADTADITVDWESGGMVVQMTLGSAGILTPEDIGMAITKCLISALEQEGSQCVAN